MVKVRAQHVLLFLLGAALSIAQFVMIRDFVSILYGEEVVIVLVTASFFFGLSVGYVVSLRLSVRVFRWLFIGSVFLHLTFPFSYRYLASWFSAADVNGWWFLALLFGYAVVFTSVFATFLPRLIAVEEAPAEALSDRLVRCYVSELAGFMTGFAVIASSWNHDFARLLVPYWIILGLVLHLSLGRRELTALYATCAAIAAVFLGRLDFHSTAVLYEEKHGIRGAEVLYSVNSPYQKVEVIESRRGTRYLYLDGLQNLNSTDLEGLNYYIAEVPAALMKPDHALLIGNGTLSSVSRVHPHSGRVTSVELDSGVLQAGKRFFTPPESLEGLDNWELHVDDGKHFLRRSEERFDLVVVDVPSPLTIQEAYLHSVEFYRLVGERLTDQGVLAVQLSGPLQHNNRTPARVTAALRQVFPEVLVIDSDRADRGFAYASRSLPFSAEDVRRESRSYERRLETIPPSEVDEYLDRAVPLAVDELDLVLRRGWERFADRYLDD